MGSGTIFVILYFYIWSVEKCALTSFSTYLLFLLQLLRKNDEQKRHNKLAPMLLLLKAMEL
jgi:hypothetical protein